MTGWTLQPGSGTGGRPPAGSARGATTCERLGAQLQTYVGIDVGADRLHCVAVDARLQVADTAIFASAEMGELVEWVPVAATVAIDAPAELSTAFHADDEKLSPKFRRARCAEIALGRDVGCWVPWVTPTTAPQDGWMATGFALYAALRADDFEPIEVFPYAAYRELVRPNRLPRKQTVAGVQARVSALRKLGIDEPNLPLWSHDDLDALVGAVVARDHARKTARAATCGHDGSAIWLPAS
jgi:predicted nuclease with RNAse H fold